jgi:TolB-like protein/DNA-binding winged helix-turn-helix (wHTH) protein
MKTSSARTVLFGPYSLDLRSGELWKFGIRVKMGEQSFRILSLLLEAQGEMVTREEIRTKLWTKDTFVDFDHGLNSAIQRLRDCLSDSVEKPRWIETIPRRGYRFVGQVEWQEENGATPVAAKETEPPKTSITPGAAPQPVHRATRGWIVAAAILILLAVGLAIGHWIGKQAEKRQAAKMIRSLAVLPIENLSGDPSQDYFADGMTDELITMLAKNVSLRVVSRTSVMQYKGVHRPLREIASELGVDGILEGSVARSASHVHLNVQLIYAPTDAHVWAESYDRDLSRAYLLPEELSQTVAEEVKIAASPAAPPRYINPEAHDAYLRGLQFWYGNNVRGGLPYFEKAIQLQPDYAAAWGGLSNTYAVLSISGEVPSSEVKERWESAARKAVELDDSLPQAHNSMAGWYLFYARDWQRAGTESLRSLALDPHFAEGYHMYSYILTVTGRMAEAIEEEKRGAAIDPFARPFALGYAYFHARQFENAVNEFRLRIEADQADDDCHFLLSESYHFLGRDQEAFEELKQNLVLTGKKAAIPILQRAFEHGGFAAVAAWRADHYSDPRESAAARAQKPGDRSLPKKYFSPFWRALATARAGRKEQTLQLLDQAYLVHDPRMIFLQNEPVFDFLHHELRYQALVQKLGLPPAY